MRFTAEKSLMLPAIETAFKYAEKNENIPILAHMLIAAKDNEVSITASNLDRVCRTSFQAAVTEPGEICLPAAKLTTSVKQSAGTEVSIRTEGDSAIMTAGRAVFKIPAMTKEGFPDAGMLTSEGSYSFEIDAEILSRAVKEVNFACSTEQSRYFLCGTAWSVENGQLDLVATNSYLISALYSPAPVGSAGMSAIIVPPIDIPKWSGIVEATVTDFFIRFHQPGCTIATKLIDGEFPDYRRLIPAENPTCVIVDRAELASAIARIAPFGDGLSSAIRFTAERGELRLSTRSTFNEADDVIPCSGDDLEQIILGHRIISPLLASFDCETIEMHIGSETAPILFRSPTDANRIAVAWPMRDVRLAFAKAAA